MFSKPLPLTIISLLATTTLALPNVTIKPLPLSCASYPDYNASTGSAGPWLINTANSDNPDLEGLGDSVVYSVVNTTAGPRMGKGYLTISHRPDIAHIALQCTNSTLHAYTKTSLDSSGTPTAMQWTPLSLSPDPSDARLVYSVDDGVVGQQPTAYEHYIEGQKQDGVFFGGYNTTTWGVKWYEAGEGSWGFPYFGLRLVPEGEALRGNETRTFVRVYV